ncbi:uncharacterized protein TrAFT101_008557 [Trichoderma asperellum]|uniref:uncharacterized protein n=1 Tax=Trichoderma asperellum TaxID=101201 RepID=UPI003330C088|nr:hypothetical protein TrAFT101_008557 [Trichoderma asperellum]
MAAHCARSSDGRRGPSYAYLPNMDPCMYLWIQIRAEKHQGMQARTHQKNHSQLYEIGMGGERHEHAEDGLAAASWP